MARTGNTGLAGARCVEIGNKQHTKAFHKELYKMAAAVELKTSEDPKFITKLFTMKKYRCHFVVGNKDQIEPESIGVVIEMLMAHSEVLESEMLVREIENNKCVTVTDLEPVTFKNLLRYTYGFDNTGSLCFDEADDLLYAAEKYMIEPLKARLAERLIKLLTPDNICGLLHNPACYKTLELNSTITKILQQETDKVLASPLFLDLSPDTVTKVFEQEAMNVEELEVWRAAVKWAKHRTNSDNGQDLRRALEGPAKHIRVLTIDDVSFADEVVPTGILTDKECISVFSSKLGKRKLDDLDVFSSNREIRTKYLQECELEFINNQNGFSYNVCTISIVTRVNALELVPFKLMSAHWRHDSFVPDKLKYELTGKITITRITDYINDTSTESPQIVKVCQTVEFGKQFTVPMTVEGRNIVLRPNNKYCVEFVFNHNIEMLYSKVFKVYDNEHLSLKPHYNYNYDTYRSVVPFSSLFYKPI